MTKTDQLLLAAASFGDAAPFAFADLVLKAWELYPDSFSLGGGLTHPDSHALAGMCSRAVRPHRLLERTGPNLYQLTESGWRRVRKLTGQHEELSGEELPRKQLTLPAADAALLAALFDSEAAGEEEVVWGDAVAFWSLTPAPAGAPLSRRVEILGAKFIDILACWDGGDAILPGGRHVTAADVEALQTLNRTLAVRFASVLRRHDEQRKKLAAARRAR